MGCCEKEGCRCAVCQAVEGGASAGEALEGYRRWAAEKLAKHGWIVHFVTGDPASPTGFNAHTHGLAETWRHRDLQIVVPLPERVAHDIFSNVVDRVKAGEVFVSGDVLEGVLGGGYKVRLVSAVEGGRFVLRVVLPDPAGNLEPAEQDEDFRLQHEGLPTLVVDRAAPPG